MFDPDKMIEGFASALRTVGADGPPKTWADLQGEFDQRYFQVALYIEKLDPTVKQHHGEAARVNFCWEQVIPIDTLVGSLRAWRHQRPMRHLTIQYQNGRVWVKDPAGASELKGSDDEAAIAAFIEKAMKAYFF